MLSRPRFVLPLLALVTTALLAPAAQARDLMLISQSANDSYYMDVDDIQSAPDFGYRAATLYRLISQASAKTEGYDYTQIIMGFDCSKQGQVTLVQVIAFDATGRRVREEHSDRELANMDWMSAPEGTHFGQAWLGACKDRRSSVRPGNVAPDVLLQPDRKKRATSAALP